MSTMEGVILGAALFGLLMIAWFFRDKLKTNRQFKPMPIVEAEKKAKLLIQKKYGKGNNYMKNWHKEFIIDFPIWSTYSYDHILLCLNPNQSRHNPDLVEDIFTSFNLPQIIEGSISHKSLG